MHALQILEWQLEAGADESIGETPVNRLIPSPAGGGSWRGRTSESSMSTLTSPPPNLPPAGGGTFGTKLVAPAEAVAATRKIADACTTRAELEAAVRAFDGLSIKKTAMNTVFSDGNPNAKIMLIGEAPGAQEDQQGIPFCGPSGKLLDKMLSSINVSRETNAYISNTVFWRPPGNRQPTPEELATCQPFVQKHIALIQPKLLIALGGVATNALLQKDISISRMRLKLYDYSNPYLEAPIATAVTFHPSYLMRSPGQKKLAWQDLQFIRKWLEENGVL